MIGERCTGQGKEKYNKGRGKGKSFKWKGKGIGEPRIEGANGDSGIDEG